jgi:hypothetical protein
MRRGGRLGTAIATIGVLAAGVLVGAQAASATITGGVLGIHGAGSLFAGTNESNTLNGALVSLATTPGGTVAFPSEVINKGESLAQFEVQVSLLDTSATAHLIANSVDVTSLAQSSGGYITPPIAPGKAQAMTLKITAPTNADSVDGYFAELDLFSYPGAVHLARVAAEATVKNSAGTTDHDLFVTSASQPTVSGKDNVTTPQNGYFVLETAPTVHVGGTATFTATVKNDTAVTHAITLRLNSGYGCASAWQVVAKAGTTDITALITGSGYVTAPLAKGGSAKVVVTVKALAVPDSTNSSCADAFENQLTATGADGNYNYVMLTSNAVP